MKIHFVTLALFGTLLAVNTHAAGACPFCSGQSDAAIGQPGASPFSSESVYQFQGRWTNDSGRPATLAGQKGRIQVVTMFFARCQYACPLLVYKMQQIEAALPARVRSKVAFTLVSFDSRRDTPDALREYRAQHHLGTNWTLLHGDAEDVLELAALLNVKFRELPTGQFQHSNLITVLNADGEIAYQESGLKLETGAVVHEIDTLASQKGNIHAPP